MALELRCEDHPEFDGTKEPENWSCDSCRRLRTIKKLEVGAYGETGLSRQGRLAKAQLMRMGIE